MKHLTFALLASTFTACVSLPPDPPLSPDLAWHLNATTTTCRQFAIDYCHDSLCMPNAFKVCMRANGYRRTPRSWRLTPHAARMVEGYLEAERERQLRERPVVRPTGGGVEG